MVARTVNRQVRLAARPVGLPKKEDWAFTEEPVPEAGQDEMLIKVLYISLDPAMRGWMNEGRSYIPPVGIGDVMRAQAIGRVIKSHLPAFGEGDHVLGAFGAQEYAISDGAMVFKVEPALAPLPVFMSTLGMTGLTAYFGLLDIGKPKAGETVVVSGAGGAVGQVVGQIAKIKGCRVVGIAGGPEKCKFLIGELGFDAAIDYKNENVAKALKEHCPDRINVYFDNVGGDILETVLTRLARHARVVICGSISQYNNTGPAKGPSNYMMLLVDRARMEGFLVFDYADRYMEAIMEMAGWMAEGKLKSKEQIEEGLENFPATLNKLFKGENLGKLILKVGD